MAVPPIHEVALDPQWIPHMFDQVGQHLTSVFIPQGRRKELVFLTDGHFRGNFRKVTLPFEAVATEVAGAAETEARLHFIFHTSFCCSTLLARALDVPGVATSLSEPNILVNLAERVIRTGLVDNQARLELGLRLLERPLENAGTVIAKASSFANRLIEPILNVRPDSRGILLYSDPATFLGSILKRGLLGRINARKLYQNLIAWTSLKFGFSQVETFEQTDLQIAGLAWLMQMAHFNQIAQRFGRGRVVAVDAAELMANPGSELHRVEAFFGLGLGDEDIRRIVDGPVFSKHSKFSDLDYDSEVRRRNQEGLMEVHAEELGMVVQWLNAVAAHLRIPLRPGAAA